MKKIRLILLSLSINFAGTAQQINDSLAIQWLQYLASDTLKGRLTGTPELKMAGQKIAAYFEATGLQKHPLFQSYLHELVLPHRNDTLYSANVVGWLPGTQYPDEYILLTAHYDHIGTTASSAVYKEYVSKRVISKDSIYNGANDNATGTAAVLTLADYYKKNPPARSILFIAFTGEEIGLRGSFQMVDALKSLNIIAMINIEMIGRGINKKVKQPFLTGSQYSDIKEILNESLYRTNNHRYGQHYIVSDPFPEHKLFMRSDNYYFARVGVPAHTIITSSPAERFYHHVHDNFENIDLPHFTATIQTIALSLNDLVNARATPKRINILLLEDK